MMINKEDVICFFDRCAPTWDEHLDTDDELIDKILDNGGVHAGTDVLDVACGTGVLFPYYLNRRVASVTAIDISPKMAGIASSKYPADKINVICGDVEETVFHRLFDAVMVYNAFPHFPDPQKLIKSLSSLVKPGGKLSVAHGMSREKLDRHHSGAAHSVSNGLMSVDDLAGIFDPWFDVDVKISDDRMYQISGVRKEE